jgi:hypothetical protein
MNPIIIIAVVVFILIVVAVGGYFAFSSSPSTSSPVSHEESTHQETNNSTSTQQQQPQQPSQYTFYQGMDSDGNDINQQANLVDNISGLESWCTAQPSCKGFNTNGWMKQNILPQGQWSKWTTEPTKGLYVRNY